MKAMERIFKLQQSGTTIRTEILAGVTTFMTMAYILAVNPNILADAGMDRGSVFVATVLASAIGSILMGLRSNYPFALAPGMGLNAFFAYTVVIGMGYTWQMALAAVLVEGVIFYILSVLNVREGLFNAIPTNLKLAVSAGIGLFITFIGLQNAKITVSNPSTLVSMFAFKGAEKSLAVTVLLAIIGVLITGALMIKNVKGGILWGILATWVLGMICQATGLYVPNVEAGLYSLFPSATGWFVIPPMTTFMQLDFSNMLSFNFLTIMLSFLYVDMFDTMGTLIGVATKAGMLDKNGKLPRIKNCMKADAVATGVGAIFGTSTTTTFVESAAGVAVGGRTGLTAVVTGLLFLVSLFFSPLFLAIPSFATAPALIVVGVMMFSSVKEMDFSDWTEYLPAFICIIAMPFMYSISEGIALGTISYVVFKLIGRKKGEKISPVLIVLAVLFVLKYRFI